jgi:hypothetical protein
MLSTSTIILEYVCPGLGVLVGTYMFMAPLKDCYDAVKAGKGFGDLNPTPWAFCTGNCIGVRASRLASFFLCRLLIAVRCPCSRCLSLHLCLG